MITQKEVRRCFSYNKKTGILRRKVASRNAPVGAIAGNKMSTGYLKVSFKNKQYLCHVLIWFGMKGYFPKEIDHKDRVRDNNKWKNLRKISHKGNSINKGRQSNNTSGIPGISWDKSRNKWYVKIKNEGIQYALGRFDDFDEAVCHRFAAEQCFEWEKYNPNSSAHKYMDYSS